jgi:hypothetical protein
VTAPMFQITCCLKKQKSGIANFCCRNIIGLPKQASEEKKLLWQT